MIGSNNKNTVGTILFFTAAKLSEPKKRIKFSPNVKAALKLRKFNEIQSAEKLGA